MKGVTALMMAIMPDGKKGGDVGIVQMLLEKGATVDREAAVSCFFGSIHYVIESISLHSCSLELCIQKVAHEDKHAPHLHSFVVLSVTCQC